MKSMDIKALNMKNIDGGRYFFKLILAGTSDDLAGQRLIQYALEVLYV